MTYRCRARDIEARRKTKFAPLPHQEFVLDYLIQSEYRGLLLYHELGSGKSCTSIMYADYMADLIDDPGFKVYVFSAAATRQNFIGEYCRVCGKDPRILRDNFEFLAYNAGNVLGKLPESFEDSIVIVDEAHNLINGKRNGAKVMSGVYDRINETADKVLLLSGTPINKIGDIPLLANLLKEKIFPLEYDEYDNYHPKKFFYNFTKTQMIKIPGNLGDTKFSIEFDILVPDEEKLGPIFAGVVSYVATGGEEFYPKRIDIPFDKTTIAMSQKQVEEFLKKVGMEQQIITKGRPDEKLKRTKPKEYKEKMQLWIVANNRLFSRTISNVLYPASIEMTVEGVPHIYYSSAANFAIQEMLEEMAEMVPKGTGTEFGTVSTRIGTDVIKVKNWFPPDAPYEPGTVPPNGWITKTMLDAYPLRKMSPKILQIFKNILTHINGKHVIFSSLKSRSGINFIRSALEVCNRVYKKAYKKLHGKYPPISINTIVYSGDIGDSERKELLDMYNGVDNVYGERYKIMLLTEAGSTGITLKNVTDVHILESNIKETTIRQVIGRAIRYKSHENLPEDERLCRVWRYFATPSNKTVTIKNDDEISYRKNSKMLIDELGIDKVLYYRGESAITELTGFTEIFKRFSIEKYDGKIETEPVKMRDPITITITFGDRAETRTGMEKKGTSAIEGLSVADLKKAQYKLKTKGIRSVLVDLTRSLPEKYRKDAEPAAILIIKKPLEKLGGYGMYDMLLEQLLALDWDKKALDIRTKQVVNLHARYNLVFGDEDQEPNYKEGKGRIIAFDHPHIRQLERIRNVLPKIFGPKAENLQGEGNYYHDISKCGIGFHGDAERKIVIAQRLGETIPIFYRWYFDGEPVSPAMQFLIEGGDMYAMSSKAVGTDWKRKSVLTLRHAAGCPTYVELSREDIDMDETKYVEQMGATPSISSEIDISLEEYEPGAFKEAVGSVSQSKSSRSKSFKSSKSTIKYE